MDSLTKVLPPTSNLLSDAMALPHQHPRLAVAISVTALSIPWAIDNYHKYLALGRGGMPYNVLGWLGSTAFKPFGRETLSVAMYSDSDGQSWLDGELVERRGTRPRTGWHFLPHRQVDKIPGKKTCDALDKLFAEVASRNPSLVILTRSPHEGLVQGMVIHQDVPSPHKTADKCWREIGHVHPPDHSLHVVLSPKDCKLGEPTTLI